MELLSVLLNATFERTVLAGHARFAGQLSTRPTPTLAALKKDGEYKAIPAYSNIFTIVQSGTGTAPCVSFHSLSM